MLESIDIKNVGPAPELHMDFAPRLNILTGDNGLGKTFFLDIAWSVLTRTWSRGVMARPAPGLQDDASIAGSFGSHAAPALVSRFSKREERWETPKEHKIPYNVVLYQQVDGGISFFEPLKHTTSQVYSNDETEPSVISEEWGNDSQCYSFNEQEILNGAYLDAPTESSGEIRICNGLIDDWIRWKTSDMPQFKALKEVLSILSPHSEPLLLGQARRIALHDVRDVPTIKLPYGEIPVTQLSAGMRRILSLAYMVVWAYFEHVQTAKFMGASSTKKMVILIDELEAHLHPQWQRTILKSVLEAVKNVIENASPNTAPEIQIIATSHSPLVLASLEPLFDEEKDQVQIFSLEEGKVTVEEMPWAKHGDADGWLTSDIFGLKEPRSIEAEEAIGLANAFMRGEDTDPDQESIHKMLLDTLADDDPFWLRWVVKTEGVGAGE